MEPIRRTGVPEDITNRILELIKTRHFQPGDKLPSERELAEMLGVSRPSLREAMRTLDFMNVVSIRQGDGTYVTSLEPELLVAHLDFVYALGQGDLAHLFQARKVVEPGIAAIAAATISAEELAHLDACLDRARASVDDAAAFIEADIDLHRTIIQAARNPLLARFMASVWALGRASRERTAADPAVRRRSLRDHEAIVAALRRHEPEAARRAMLDHLAHVERGGEQ